MLALALRILTGSCHGEALQLLTADSLKKQADPEEVGSAMKCGGPEGEAEPHWHVSLG